MLPPEREREKVWSLRERNPACLLYEKGSLADKHLRWFRHQTSGRGSGEEVIEKIFGVELTAIELSG